MSELPVLWASARDLFQTPAFGDTVGFARITHRSVKAHRDIDPGLALLS
jgi:glutathionyl-hydroquinone reductase